jgi:branched-subunit amino acid aminotransferase/4-amino-4-deoxychorismate lyase
MANSLAVVDGRFSALSEALIPVDDPAVTLGWSVFETLLVEDGGIPCIAAHLTRLRSSASAAMVPFPDDDLLAREMEALASAGPSSGRMRVTLTGAGRRILTVEPLDPSRRHGPVRAVRREHRPEPFLGGAVKHGSRAPWVVAVRRSGADEVLFVDQGVFTEGTTSAILAVIDGVLWSHPDDGGVLASTTRQSLLQRAAALGIPVRHEGPPAAGPWDALYIASATRDLAPVVELDGVALPGWDPIGRRLADVGSGFS